MFVPILFGFYTLEKEPESESTATVSVNHMSIT